MTTQVWLYLCIALVSIGTFIGIILWRGQRVERRFWEIVQGNPDAAWVRFINSSTFNNDMALLTTGRAPFAFFVDEVPGRAIRHEYAGPFRFTTTDEVEHAVYVIQTSGKLTRKLYAEIARHLLDDDATEEARLRARKEYDTDPRGAGAAPLREFEASIRSSSAARRDT